MTSLEETIKQLRDGTLPPGEKSVIRNAINSMSWMVKHFVWEQWQNQHEYSNELKDAIQTLQELVDITGAAIRFCPCCSCPVEMGMRDCPVCNEGIAEHYS